jgi:peroxiredoxin
MNNEPSEGTALGEIHPEFELPGLNGQPVHLSDYRGKNLLIFMWASW